MQRLRPEPCLPRPSDLIGHERDERTDDNGQPGQDEGWDLIADALSPTCWEHTKCVGTRQSGFDEGSVTKIV